MYIEAGGGGMRDGLYNVGGVEGPGGGRGSSVRKNTKAHRLHFFAWQCAF